MESTTKLRLHHLVTEISSIDSRFSDGYENGESCQIYEKIQFCWF